MPWWATERLVPRAPAAREEPFITVAERRGRLVIDAVNRRADRAGLVPGMPLADGRAIAPAVVVRPADLSGDLLALEKLARWANRFTPRVMPAPPGTLFLDIRGCAHLFGGEASLASLFRAKLEGFGLAACLGLADTPGAAWALARYGAPKDRGGTRITPSAGLEHVKRALAELPVAALRLEPGVAESLASFGLERIRSLYPLAPGALCERFGPVPTRRLKQALGLLEEPLVPLKPPVPREARRVFAEPIADREHIRAALDGLIESLCAALRRTDEGARRLRLVCHRADGGCQSLVIGTSRPLRRKEPLLGLFAEELDRIDPGFGIDEMVLIAEVAEAAEDVQADGLAGLLDSGVLDSGGWESDGLDPLAGLLDRLGNRFGFERIARPLPFQSWLPERAVRLARPLAVRGEPLRRTGNEDAADTQGWPSARHRPVRLLSPPEPVEVISSVPEGPPVFFRWQGRAHTVRAAAGPERLECEWWYEDTPPRDYYLTEDEEGRRYWLFRDGSHGRARPPRWFLHGLFG